MRIISGNLSGRVIKNKLPSGIRPTKDSVKESIFNILQNMIDFENTSVADICAGSGSLGFEALSRSAGSCIFIDIMKQSADYVSKAAANLGLNENSFSVIKSDAIEYLRLSDKKFDVVFFDPPYKSNLYSRMSKLLDNKDIITEEGLIIIEMPFFGFFKFNQNFKIIKEKIAGDTKIIIAKRLSH